MIDSYTFRGSKVFGMGSEVYTPCPKRPFIFFYTFCSFVITTMSLDLSSAN